ncbi:hypothetical protein CPC197_0555B, partial [Chlamydia psittaci C1/97]
LQRPFLLVYSKFLE